jgi:hypothetical protein
MRILGGGEELGGGDLLLLRLLRMAKPSMMSFFVIEDLRLES